MNRIDFEDRNTSIWLGVLYRFALLFSLILAGCANQVLYEFSRLEAEALKYGTVSVGAVRVTDYNNVLLRSSRIKLQDALENIRTELGCGLTPPAVAAESKKSNPDKEAKIQTTGTNEMERIGLRMAALKFVESELRDLRLNCITPPNEPDFRRVVLSLDCSAWVSGKAAAALVYVDLYPCNADAWCHKAAGILRCYLDEKKNKEGNNDTKRKLCLDQKPYPKTWKEVMEEELDEGFTSFDSSTLEFPEEKILSRADLYDPVAFCHRWLEEKNLFPHIVHVERMGAAEYLILAEGDYSASKLGISGTYPGLPSAEVGIESRRETQLQTATIRPLSLAFIAGDQRAGWLFMPTKTREGRMLPTERRLRMVVDIPDKMSRLSIHIHKVFLGKDLCMLPDATLVKQMKNLEHARDFLTQGDDLYVAYKEQPKLYRLIKTRMRNLLYQGWAEEIPVDIPNRENETGRIQFSTN